MYSAEWLLISRGLDGLVALCSFQRSDAALSGLSQPNTHLRKGDDGGGDTPLPIPNREVKPASADGTARETSWESRSSPIFLAELFVMLPPVAGLTAPLAEPLDGPCQDGPEGLRSLYSRARRQGRGDRLSGDMGITQS